MLTTPRALESRSPESPDSSPKRIGEILPSLGITKRRYKQVESLCLIRQQRARAQQDLAFNARPFVLCGLPFGQDRLIPIWIATLALWQKSRELQFDSAAQMLDFFHLPKDGPHYRRLVNVITVSEAFYHEIDAHRIPFEREVAAVLAHAPGMLDFYIWLAWKTWTTHAVLVRIPLTGPQAPS